MDKSLHNLRVSSLDHPSINVEKPQTSKAEEAYFWNCPLPPDDNCSNTKSDYPKFPFESQEEDREFNRIYEKLPEIWQALKDDENIGETVVIVPSLTLDPEELHKIGGIEYYEERLLFFLILLTEPHNHVIFITTQPIRDRIIDYYLQLLPGVPYTHARKRLHMYSVNDASYDKSLTEKILERPALIKRLKKHINESKIAHLSVFNVTHFEKSLSVVLGIPLMGADPRHLHFGTKSGARKIFRQTGVLFPDGFEDIKDEKGIAEAIVNLYFKKPQLKRVVVKINEGFSGEGNAIYKLDDLKAIDPVEENRQKAQDLVLKSLPEKLKLQAANLTYSSFIQKFELMEGVVEEFLEGIDKESPSIQTRLTPLAEPQIISTHDQIMGGDDGQVFLGCRFPAMSAFHEDLHKSGMMIAQHMTKYGLVERVSIDYLAVPQNPTEHISASNPWKLYAIEINMRKGGTTHPFRTLQFLTGGHYNSETGVFTTPNGTPKFYVASDNLSSPKYKGLLPEDLIDIVTFAGLHYNSTTNKGVIFHIIGALSQYGKLGVTCIGNSPKEAQMLYEKTVAVIDSECKSTRWMI